MNRKFPQFPLPSSALLGNELVLIWKNGANRRLAISELGAFLADSAFDGNPSSLNQEGATLGQVITWDGTQWSPATGSGGTTLPDGTDNGQLLRWNNDTSQYEIATGAKIEDNLLDITITDGVDISSIYFDPQTFQLAMEGVGYIEWGGLGWTVTGGLYVGGVTAGNRVVVASELGAFVDLTTNQNVDGEKTFLDSVITNGGLMLQNNLDILEKNGYATINYQSTKKFIFRVPQDVDSTGFQFLMGGLTAERGYTLPDATGTIALESYVDDALFTDFEPSTGNLSFAPVDGKPKKYGFTTALTGNITFSTTDAKETVMIKARWNDSTLPTVSVSGGGVTLVKTGDFVISVDNFIDAICDKNDAGTVTHIRYSISQA